MGPAAIIAGVGLAVSAVGTYKSVKESKKQTKEMKKAATYQRQMDRLRAARERREAIRNARLASGASLQASVNQGVQTSSAALGSLGSIEQQLNQGLSFLDATNELQDQAGQAIGRANVHASKAANAAAIGQFGMQVFSSANSIFKTQG